MSKRRDTIRSLFSQTPAPALSADNQPEPARVTSGAVRSMKDTFSGIERENEQLRARIAAGEQVQDIDAELVDASPFADRFGHDDDAAFEALRQSIADRGQAVPALLRENPAAPGRYQVAFGHRRVRAARSLGLPVKAIVRPLDDDALAIAQGVENAAREDLTFIERAMFALRLEEAGRSRLVIQQALAIDKAEVSKLISVVRATPEDVVRAIGKAPRVGRGRWQEFAELLRDSSAVLTRVRKAVGRADFATLGSDDRFRTALDAAKARGRPERAAASVQRITDPEGNVLAELQTARSDIRLRIASGRVEPFATFLGERMPELLKEFDALNDRVGDV